MSSLRSIIPLHTISHPRNGGDLFKTLGEAKENGLKIKCFGGTYPVNIGSADVLVSLDGMKRIICYDPNEQTFTVEVGLTIKELLYVLEYLNYTIPLYGIIPNMSIADAISVGLMSSSGKIADCLNSCEVLFPDGALLKCKWPPYEVSPRNVTCVPTTNTSIPTLETIVCGLGVVGIITAATLQCIPLHLAQEYMYECSSSELKKGHKETVGLLYKDYYWYPLLDKVIVTNATSTRLQLTHFQPWWKKCLELIFKGCHYVVYRLSHVISWYFPSAAKYLSRMQFNLKKKALSYRDYYSFRAQHLVSVNSYSRGIKWALPSCGLPRLFTDVHKWTQHNSHLCSTPLIISMQTQKNQEVQRPFLSPYKEEDCCTVWTNWFNSKSIVFGFSATMAEFESILERCSGRKCWSAGPIFVSPLIGQMYPGYRHWCNSRQMVDPQKMFQSPYVTGDIFI